MMKRHALILIVGFAVAAGGCGREAEPEYPNQLLKHVPVDTPYVFASGEPMPEELTERMRRTFQPLVEEMQASMEMSFNELEAERPELAKRLRAATAEMMRVAGEGGMEAAGLSHDDRFVLYGNGLAPVMRLTVSDPQAFREYITGIFQAAELEMPEATFGEFEYWRGEFGPALVAAGIRDGVFAVGAARMEDSDAMLNHLFSGEMPERSIADSGAMSALVDDYGFLEQMAGFVDSVRLAELLIGDGDGNPGLLDAFEVLPPDITPACRTEVRSLVAKAPRLVFGYDALDEKRMATRTVLELEPAIAGEMSGWSTPVPGLGTSDDARAVFGYGLDLVKVGASVQNWMRQAAERQFDCALLNTVEWGKSAGQVNTAPLYMAGNPKGMVMRLDELRFNDLESGDVEIEGSVVMLFENAKTLAAMAQSFVPQLQSLQIPADGTPVAIPVPEEAKARFDQPAFVAMTETVMGVSVGEGGEERLVRAMETGTVEKPPVLQIAFDAGWLYGHLAELMPKIAEQQAGEGEMDDATREELERSAKLMRVYGEVFDRLSSEVHFTDRGVSLEQEVTLQ